MPSPGGLFPTEEVLNLCSSVQNQTE